MGNDSLESVGWRLDRLERENRFLRRVIVCFLLLASTVIAMGQARPSRILEADAFLLKDATGRIRARLSMEAEGRPTLTYLDQKGNLVAALAGGDEPFLILNKNGSNEQVQLGANKGLVGLAIYDKGIRAGLSLQKGTPSLDLFDENGRPALSEDPASLVLFGKDQKVLWSVP